MTMLLISSMHNQKVLILRRLDKMRGVIMIEHLKDVINMAIKEEEYFQGIYRKFAVNSDNPSVKALFNKLAEQEKLHKERLQSFDFENSDVITEKIQDIDAKDDLLLTPVSEFKDMKNIFEFAIENEIKAQKLYTSLAAAMNNEKARELFELLAKEEKGHEQLLKQEGKAVGFLD